MVLSGGKAMNNATRRHVMAGPMCAAALVGSVLLAGCGERAAERRPGPAELALITQQLDAELNGAAKIAHHNLVHANLDKRIFADELNLAGNSESVPVDWWNYRRGFLKLAGADGYLAYFKLTPKGEAFAAAAPPRYLTSSFQAPPRLTCAGERNWVSCKVAAVAAITSTAQGADGLEGPPAPALPIEADLSYGPQGWTATELHTTSGPPAFVVGRTALLGDSVAAGKARYQFAVQMNKRVR